MRKHYWIYPTRACNLKCSYCYQSHDGAGLFMSRQTAERVIEFIKRDSPGQEKLIQFFGGEPLLAWETILLFVESLKDYTGISFSITTNGTLLTRERLEFLKDNNFALALSLDGPPGVTRRTRPGSENVDLDLIHEFYPNSQIIMTLSPANIEDGYRSTLWFIEKGFRSIAHNIAIEKPWPRAAVKAHHKVFEQLADYCIERSNKGGVPPGFMFFGWAMKAANGSRYKGEKNICGSNANLISIDINGDIYPCQDMVTCDTKKEWVIGDIVNGYIPPRSIPLSEMKFSDREACKVCWFYHQCVGGCGPKNILVCGDRFSANTNGCELHAKQLQEGIRILLNTGKLQLIEKEKDEIGRR